MRFILSPEGQPITHPALILRLQGSVQLTVTRRDVNAPDLSILRSLPAEWT